MTTTTASGTSRASVGWLLAHAEAVPDGDEWLTPDERRAQARYTIAHRRRDWRLGRWTAKQALAAWFAGEGRPVRPGDVGVLPRAADDGRPEVHGLGDRAPSLSISHRSGVGLVAVGPVGAAVGCDLERIERRAARFPGDWFTAAECAAIEAADGDRRDELVTLVWSAKESVLKAVGDGLRRDTRRVDVDLGHDHRPADELWMPFLATDLDDGGAYTCWVRRRAAHLAVVAVPAGDTPTVAPERLLGGWAS